MLKNDVAHGLTVSPPNRDKLTMRLKPLKRLDLILSLSKDEDTFSGFFSILLAMAAFVVIAMRDVDVALEPLVSEMLAVAGDVAPPGVDLGLLVTPAPVEIARSAEIAAPKRLALTEGGVIALASFPRQRAPVAGDVGPLMPDAMVVARDAGLVAVQPVIVALRRSRLSRERQCCERQSEKGDAGLHDDLPQELFETVRKHKRRRLNGGGSLRSTSIQSPGFFVGIENGVCRRFGANNPAKFAGHASGLPLPSSRKGEALSGIVITNRQKS
jgi:hypothetical protein